MRLFDFLKRKKEETITLEKVEDWINNYLSKNDIKDELLFSERDLNSKKTKLKEYLEELNSLEITRLNEKGNAYLEGNRKSYTQEMNHLLNSIHISKDPLKAKEQLEQTSQSIEEFDKKTKRNFYILKEFDQNLMNKISSKIYDLDKIISKSIERLNKEDLEALVKIKDLKQKYHDELEELKNLQKEIDDTENIRLDFYDRKDKEQQKINKIKKTPKYEDLKELENKVKEIVDKLNKIKDELNNFILTIKPALKKELKKKKGSIKDFIEDPLKFKGDLDRVLKSINHEIENYPKKKEVMLKKLKVYDKNKIINLKKEHKELEEELKNVSKRINNNITHLNIKEYEGRKSSIDESIELENKKIVDTRHKMERINPKITKQKIRDEIKKIDENTRLIL